MENDPTQPKSYDETAREHLEAEQRLDADVVAHENNPNEAGIEFDPQELLHAREAAVRLAQKIVDESEEGTFLRRTAEIILYDMTEVLNDFKSRMADETPHIPGEET